MVAFKNQEPQAEHLEARMAVLNALRPHQEKLDGAEIVAILAYTLGQCVAMLDQRKYTPELAMALVNQNVTLGNQAALEEVRNSI